MLDFTSKLDTYTERTLFSSLDPAGQTFVRDIAVEHRLTFQEFRRVVLAARDLTLWREGDLGTWWRAEQALTRLSGRPLKKHLLARLQVHMESLGRAAKAYSHDHPLTPTHRQRKPVVSVRSDKKVWGMCPVASEKTVCCNLRTIDAVENCTFGCSYCSVQTFYSDRIVFDPDLERKLGEANIEADRFYHFGTGQASDSLT